MAKNLPKPASRKEDFLAKAAGMTGVSLPTPASREELYLNAIAKKGGGGGGTSYTAGEGIDITDDTISVDTTTIQKKLTAGSNISILNNTISATDTTYSNFTGTDGTAAGSAGLVPAPATTDAGKFLKADGTWDTAGGGGGGDTVYSDKSTSNSTTGGAVYIGNLDANQEEQPDPTTTDNHYRYFYALPYDNPTSTQAPKNGSINILGECKGEGSVVLGLSAYDALNNYYQTVIGQGAHSAQSSTVAIGYTAGTSAENSVAIGRGAQVTDVLKRNSVALGAYAAPSRRGEVNIGTGGNNLGYDNTDYRVLGGVHDGQNDHDAVTLSQLNGRVKQNAGAPTTATVGTVGQLLEDTTNGKLYQCTAASGGSYTWVEVGAGGGGGTGQGMITLSSDNFNYDSQGGTNYDTVAIWLLDDGFYKMPDNYTTVPVKGADNGSDMTTFNTAISTGVFKCFIKMNKEVWMFVNYDSQSSAIYADRPIAFYKINPANGFLSVDSSWQLAKRGEITS